MMLCRGRREVKTRRSTWSQDQMDDAKSNPSGQRWVKSKSPSVVESGWVHWRVRIAVSNTSDRLWGQVLLYRIQATGWWWWREEEESLDSPSPSTPLYPLIIKVTWTRSCDRCMCAWKANAIDSRGSVEHNESYLVCYHVCFLLFCFNCFIT